MVVSGLLLFSYAGVFAYPPLSSLYLTSNLIAIETWTQVNGPDLKPVPVAQLTQHQEMHRIESNEQRFETPPQLT